MRNHRRWAVVLDFDGTITTKDVQHGILRRFAGVTPAEFARARGHNAIDEGWVHERYLRVTRPGRELLRYASGRARPRPGFRSFVRWCGERRIPVEVVSGGIDLYLDPLLKRWDAGHLRRFRGVSRRTKKGLSVRYPYLRGRTLDWFKRRRVRARREEGRSVLFAGDGPSDLGAARMADLSFAAGPLLAACRRRSVPVLRLCDFHSVRRRLEGLCSRT